MGRSRARLASDWFAKLRQNDITGTVEHTDVADVDTAAVKQDDSPTFNTVTANAFLGDGSGLTGVPTPPTQATATWEAGTDTVESLVSATNVAAAIAALGSGGEIVASSGLTSSFGYIKLANGLIIQWSYSSAAIATTINYPIAFTSRVFWVSAQLVLNARNYQSTAVATSYGSSLTGITVHNDGNPWALIAIGR